jgi:hypothetical protein
MNSISNINYIINPKSLDKIPKDIKIKTAEVVEKDSKRDYSELINIGRNAHFHVGDEFRKLAGNKYYDEDSDLFENLKHIVRNNGYVWWNKKKGEIRDEQNTISTQDQLLLIGWYASKISEPEDWKRAEEYGFLNFHDFIGCIGANLINEIKTAD